MNTNGGRSSSAEYCVVTAGVVGSAPTDHPTGSLGELA